MRIKSATKKARVEETSLRNAHTRKRIIQSQLFQLLDDFSTWIVKRENITNHRNVMERQPSFDVDGSVTRRNLIWNSFQQRPIAQQNRAAKKRDWELKRKERKIFQTINVIALSGVYCESRQILLTTQKKTTYFIAFSSFVFVVVAGCLVKKDFFSSLPSALLESEQYIRMALDRVDGLGCCTMPPPTLLVHSRRRRPRVVHSRLHVLFSLALSYGNGTHEKKEQLQNQPYQFHISHTPAHLSSMLRRRWTMAAAAVRRTMTTTRSSLKT